MIEYKEGQLHSLTETVNHAFDYANEYCTCAEERNELLLQVINKIVPYINMYPEQIIGQIVKTLNENGAEWGGND